jgi:hypothetical protein
MTNTSEALLLWSPRVLGVLVCIFLSVFALDAFDASTSFSQAVPDFLIHLAPTVVLLGVVALSWRWQWIGALVFIALAVGYAYLARRHVAWIATVSGPLLAVGILFLFSWIHRQR